MQDKLLNMDYSQRVVIETAKQNWFGSPADGVWRKPLEREADEHGYTSSIVKFDAGSSFKTHAHPLGEELFVLEGVFSDENGDYPAGTYIRNPPGSHHAPFSKEGCTLFVKLDQFDENDLNEVKINTNQTPWRPGIGGLEVMPLHEFKHEHVALVKWPKNEKFQPHRHFGGEEIFTLSGSFMDEFGEYPKGTWIRSPHLSAHDPFVKEETIIWVKTGHLPV